MIHKMMSLPLQNRMGSFVKVRGMAGNLYVNKLLITYSCLGKVQTQKDE